MSDATEARRWRYVWSMSRRDREDRAERRAGALIDLVRPHMPIEVHVQGPADAWPLVGPSLLAREIGSLEAIFALRSLGREADPIVLLRGLYDHVVTFAWLAADPGEERHRRFLKSDSKARLAANDDCRKVGVPLLNDAKRAEYQRHVDELPKEMPRLSQRAEAADEHWTGNITGLNGAARTHSFRGLYAIAYRRHSAVDHASLMGLNEVTVDLSNGAKRIQLEERNPEMHGPYGLPSSSLLSASTSLLRLWGGRQRLRSTRSSSEDEHPNASRAMRERLARSRVRSKRRARSARQICGRGACSAGGSDAPRLRSKQVQPRDAGGAEKGRSCVQARCGQGRAAAPASDGSVACCGPRADPAEPHRRGRSDRKAASEL